MIRIQYMDMSEETLEDGRIAQSEVYGYNPPIDGKPQPINRIIPFNNIRQIWITP